MVRGWARGLGSGEKLKKLLDNNLNKPNMTISSARWGLLVVDENINR